MHNLHKIPPEIAAWIFESLDNIDDALRLARCCKYLHSIFDSTTVRLRVFRSIIAHGPHHQYDLRINQAVNMHARFSAEFYSTSAIPANPERRKWYTKMLEHPKSVKEIPAEAVWDIVCRWHGMRILFDLYCDETVSKDYVNSLFAYSIGIDVPDTTEFSAYERGLPKISQTLNICAHGLGPDQRKTAYERFYQALMCQWLSVEILWTVRSQVWPNASNFEHAFESTLDMWTNNPGRPLQEKLDIVEIVDFVWGFLGRKAFLVSSVPSWIENEGDHVEQQYDDNETEVENWGFFVRNVLQFLRPPQIVNLIISMWYPSEWRLDRPGLLRSLGFFDTWDGILVDPEGSLMFDTWVPLNIVDDDVVNSLKHMTATETIEDEWNRYREGLWLSEIRGNIFFQHVASQAILNRITAGEASQGS